MNETFIIKGVDCPNCARECQEAVAALDFVAEAQINVVAARLELRYCDGVLPSEETLKAIVEAVRSTHHDIDLNELQKKMIGDDERSWLSEHKELVFMIASGILLGIGFVYGQLAKTVPGFSRMEEALYILATLSGFASLFPKAFASLKRKKIDMNVLMSIAVIGAICLGAYVEGAVVLFLDQIGEYLEGYSMRKTRGSIRKLMALAPEKARVWDGGTFTLRKVQEVAVGSYIQVLPGERISLDGRIMQGHSAIDESPVTGESVPLDKGPGDQVYAGSLNTNAVIELVTTANAAESMLARIVEMVEGAQAKRAPYEDFVDRFAAWYTPLVVVIAAAIAVLPPFVGLLLNVETGSLTRWIYSALTILVISCPCALVISTPVSFVSGITKAAKIGVLVKGGAYMELANKIDCILFDKTGTLTEGRPELTKLRCVADISKEDALELAASLEQYSNHPLAQAILRAWSESGKSRQDLIQHCNAQELSGNGLTASYRGSLLALGKPSFIAELRGGELPQEVEELVAAYEAEGATALVLAHGDQILALIALADRLRTEAQETLRLLQKPLFGIRHIEILTGDNPRAAQVIAHKAGISSFQASLMPQDKIARVEELVGEGKRVAMVGDGINDAPAMAASHLGITMGAAASDTALEVSDVALMSADLSQLPAFLKLSRRTMRIVRENIAFAIGVKLLFLVLTIFGMTTMWMAVFADTGVTILVILNAMRLVLGGSSLRV